MKASSEKEKALPAQQQVTTTWVGKSRVLLRNLRVIFHPTLRCIVSLVRDWRLLQCNKAEVVCIHQQYDILPHTFLLAAFEPMNRSVFIKCLENRFSPEFKSLISATNGVFGVQHAFLNYKKCES